MTRKSKRGRGPILSLYAKVKKLHGDAIVLIRVGDFYETFYDDAETFSEVAGVMVRSPKLDGEPVPIAGVPYFAVDQYIEKCIEQGHKVALVDPQERS